MRTRKSFSRSFILAMWLSVFSSSFALAADIANDPFQQRLQHYAVTEDFQGSVLIAHWGNVVFRSAYGLADRENAIANTPDTSFLIGSLTKSFTAVTVMQLVNAGLMDLHAPIQRYIPQLAPHLAKDLTLHLLLKQKSGLISSFDGLAEFEERDIRSSELLDIINKTQLSFIPGSKYEYSNLNYTLCAIAIENVTGKSYAQVLNERTFKPLGMKNSGVERLAYMPGQRAKGYRKNEGKIEQDENNVSVALGSGDIYASANDLQLWQKALAGNRYLSAAGKQKLFDGGSKDEGYYGYGFRVQAYQRANTDTEPGTVVRHGGTMDGFMSNFQHYREDDLTVIVLGNIRPFPVRKITYEMKEMALGFKADERVNQFAE